MIALRKKLLSEPPQAVAILFPFVDIEQESAQRKRRKHLRKAGIYTVAKDHIPAAFDLSNPQVDHHSISLPANRFFPIRPDLSITTTIRSE